MLVVIGKYNLKLPLSIRISPGSFPKKGDLEEKCNTVPAMTMIIPAIIKIFPIFKNIKTTPRHG